MYASLHESFVPRYYGCDLERHHPPMLFRGNRFKSELYDAAAWSCVCDFVTRVDRKFHVLHV